MSSTSREGLYAVCGSFMILSTTAIGLRFYARRYQKVRLGWDDAFAVFGVVTYLAAASLAITFAVWGVAGYAKLTKEQTLAKAEPLGKLSFAYDFLVLNTLACAKLSALFMYRRIFVIERRHWFNITIFVTVGIIVVWYITSDFLSLYQCPRHFSAIWDGEFKKYCYNNPVWAKELALTDFILDVWVLVLPIAPIFRLHTTLAKKFSIFGVFLLAFIGLGAAIARIVFYFQAHGASQKVLYIAMLETGISITVVNLPSIYHLCTSVVPHEVARSLRSIRSLGSQTSQISHTREDKEGHTYILDAEGNKVPYSVSATGGNGSLSSQGSYLVHGNRTDVEGGHVEEYDMRSLHTAENKGIRVENGAYVTRD